MSVGLGMLVGALPKEEPGIVTGALMGGRPVALCAPDEAAADPNRRLASG